MNTMPFRRREDTRLVRGRGRFVDDEGSRALHLKIHRSPYAHARIINIDVSAAERLDGVICTLTGEELEKQVSAFMQVAPPPADQIKDYSIAVGRVRYQGEPVVAVVATSPAIASDAVELIRVDYEPLPVVMDAVEAIDSEMLLHEGAGTNQTFLSHYEWGEVDRAFEEADVVVDIDRLKFHRFSSTPLECYGCVVTWEPDGRIDMLCNLMQPIIAVQFMAAALGVSPELIRLRTQDIGGGFGIKQNLYPYIIIAALASKKAGNRTVKWAEERLEHLQGSAHGSERTFLDIKVALKASGEITAVSAKHVDDVGAFPRYEPLGGVIWSQVAPAAYKLQNLRIEFRQAVTNKCPAGPNRGYSRMHHVWFLERVLDICAHEMGVPPDEMRRKNYVPEMPWTTPNGCIYDSGDYTAMMEMAKELIGWDKWRKKLTLMRNEGRVVGIGIGTAIDSGTNNFGQASFVNPYLPFSGNSEMANASVGADGSVSVVVGSVPQGQSHETIVSQVAASELDMPQDMVHVAVGFDTARATHTTHSGTYASQFAVTGIGAVHGAVEKLRGELIKVGAMLLQSDAKEMKTTTIDGVPVVAVNDGSRHVPFAEISNLINSRTAGLPKELHDITLNCRYIYRPPFEAPDTVRKYGNLTLTYAAQVHIAVIEIDPLTHNIHILDYAAVDDCGKVINHTIVQGQVIGAISHGLGAALLENFKYDEFGNLLTATFSDYCPITLLNMPNVRYGNIESPSPFTYNGAKGMGEGGGGPLPTLSAALQDALAHRGIRIDRSHYSPSDLYELLSGQASRPGAVVGMDRRR
jgi:2-furoyl-CoA dehydrogenase large subunit